MANYVYKKTTVTTKKLAGFFDGDTGIIEVDGEEKNLLKELKDFSGGYIEVVMKLKDEEDLADSE